MSVFTVQRVTACVAYKCQMQQSQYFVQFIPRDINYSTGSQRTSQTIETFSKALRVPCSQLRVKTARAFLQCTVLPILIANYHEHATEN